MRRAMLCADDASSFLAVVSGFASACGLSQRDVSLCAGPFDRMISCLLDIQRDAAAGDCSAHDLSQVRVVPRCAYNAAALGLAAHHDLAASSQFLLHAVCASIAAASPVFCSLCNVAPLLISHIDTLRVMPDVAPYLQQEKRCSRIHSCY
jgi:hypothetical protein